MNLAKLYFNNCPKCGTEIPEDCFVYCRTCKKKLNIPCMDTTFAVYAHAEYPSRTIAGLFTLDFMFLDRICSLVNIVRQNDCVYIRKDIDNPTFINIDETNKVREQKDIADNMKVVESLLYTINDEIDDVTTLTGIQADKDGVKFFFEIDDEDGTEFKSSHIPLEYFFQLYRLATKKSSGYEKII